ncbi:MAG: DUF5679 domain-containing protein [Candidatus Uhrbacteria bacterium]|nr:hypothetical protein [Patescibacteria group bacterium]MBU1907038.1 hypothetical protein [Patescibacteria group bacterium]
MADDDQKTPTIGYCVKCKEKREMQDEEQVEMPAKGGKTRPALKGKCSVCGTGMFKILPSSAKKE